ncbi:Smr/MutS family protein [Qipengyuania sp. JC766]|uniref:Smr/MutS family protein n=1 Tax=Qipengyuania sp. JC766 TaxID=3232139 RepID=UPI00345B2331
MTHPRGLTDAEAQAWEKLAATVEPLHPARRPRKVVPAPAPPPSPAPATSSPVARPEPKRRDLSLPTRTPPNPSVPRGDGGLDSHWDRKLKAGQVAPDFTLDMHGHTLDGAYHRLESGLFQAKTMGARLVLVIAGRSRPVDAADRGQRRGAIRAKMLDWLAAGPHAGDIAAIRKAHRRHGGDGALYLVLKRRR